MTKAIEFTISWLPWLYGEGREHKEVAQVNSVEMRQFCVLLVVVFTGICGWDQIA